MASDNVKKSKLVVVQFDECKPHWAEQRGYGRILERLGMKDVRVTGDFDAKITQIYGTVDDFKQFASVFEASGLMSELGSLYEVAL